MSTKTTFKRVALVAVAALGLGVLSVAPSSAAVSAATMTHVATASVGSPATLSIAQTIGAGDTTMGTLTISSKPATSTVAIGNRDGAFSTATAAVLTSTATGFTYDSASAGTAEVTAGSTSFAATVTIIPDVVGAYTITWTPDGGTAIRSVVYAWAAAPNGASLVGIMADGGYPSSNGFVNGVAGPANTVKIRAFPITTAGSTARRLISVEGAGAYMVSGLGYDALTTPTDATDADTAATGANATFPAGATAPTTATIPNQTRATTYTDFVVATPAVGTVTVKIFSETASGSGIFSATAAGTVVVTVAATASSGSTSVSLSSVLGNTTDAAGTVATDAAVGSITGTGTPAFAVRYQIIVKDILGALRAASTTALTASVSGPGLIASTNSAASAARAITINWNGTSAADLYLFNDGTSGSSEVTVSFGSTVLATKKVTFTGAAKTLTATAWEPHITVGSALEALEVVAKDSNGNITAWTPTVLSSAPSVIASSLTCTRATASWALLGYTPGAYYCDLSGLSVGTATLTVAPGSTTTNSPTVDFRVTKSVIASATLTTDKAEYAPGEKITLILTAKDADGNLIGVKADGANYNVLASDSSATSSLIGTGFCGSNALTTTCKKSDGATPPVLIANPGTYLSAGAAKVTYYAPLVSGPVTFRGTLAASTDVAAAAQLSALSVTVNVSQTPGEISAQAAADAAAEATDAANAATDAANAAAEAADAATAAAQDAADAVAALSTQVSEMVNALKKQITALTNLVIKIQKKVKA